MKSPIKAIATATLLACGSTAALASALFTDRTAFMAAISGATIETYTCNCSSQFLGTNGAAYHGVTYTNTGSGTQNDFLIGTFYGPGANVSGSDFFQAETSSMTITFGTGQVAIGFDVNDLFEPYTYTLTVGSLSVVLSGATGQTGFVGILADTAFTTAQLSNTAAFGLLEIDNLTTMAAPVAVPEPASLALALGALGVLGAARRKRSAA